jgi:glutamate dehydrogenase
METIEARGFLPLEIVESETQWFYNELGIDDMYFSTETSDAYANPSITCTAHRIADAL